MKKSIRKTRKNIASERYADLAIEEKIKMDALTRNQEMEIDNAQDDVDYVIMKNAKAMKMCQLITEKKKRELARELALKRENREMILSQGKDYSLESAIEQLQDMQDECKNFTTGEKNSWTKAYIQSRREELARDYADVAELLAKNLVAHPGKRPVIKVPLGKYLSYGPSTFSVVNITIER